MNKHETVPMKPPAATRPLVIARRRTIELERDNLRAGAIELALRSAMGDLDARNTLAALPAKLAALQFEIDLNHQAQELAHAEDASAEIAWRTLIQTLSPEEIIGGIGREACPSRCTQGISCVLSAAAMYSGSTCMHPTRMGSLHQFNIDNSGLRIFPFRDNPRAAKVFDAACEKLNVRKKFA
jgi:hypothetical protein